MDVPDISRAEGQMGVKVGWLGGDDGGCQKASRAVLVEEIPDDPVEVLNPGLGAILDI